MIWAFGSNTCSVKNKLMKIKLIIIMDVVYRDDEEEEEGTD